MNIDLFNYIEDDIISEQIISFYKELSDNDKMKLDDIINLYINNKEFYIFLQKNLLIKKISVDYLIRLYNDFDSDNLVDSYDPVIVSTTKWI